ncbi:A24 family peptidase [Aestuariibacter halophilus]|uniref:Prepilin leader peptidase/N-methyltransferase n=1 Tax=Fluctibacter halophilus TaxID=226011 RepID=A0ABS8G7H3_9ALTE|nr:A24 family peptidase [Aestuariibacter halophilus]MCC2616468.1 A24 family peptidase [Aestuariibacter halophilus]
MPEIFVLLAESPAFFVIFVFVVSLMIGSFLNVVIHRLPIMMERSWKREYHAYFHPDDTANAPDDTTYNLVKPDSTCPKCGHQIRAWENIPVISWLALGGKCSACKTPISARYPAVELLTALLSAWAAWHFGFGWQGITAALFTWLLVSMTFIDLDKMLLPDQLTLPLLWIGLLLSLNHTFVTPQDAIIGAAAGYLSLWSVYWAFKLLTGKEGMGYGDFKLLAALGAWMGWQHLALIILLSSVVGAVLGILMLSMKGKDKRQPIPFGPYLAIAGWIALLYGQPIADWYWGLMLP